MTFFKKHIVAILSLCVLFIFVFLTLNKHSKSKPFTYHSEIWADKAGYYIYLPSTFIYNFDARQLPDSICEKTGDGFQFTTSNKISTKYTYGVSLFELPGFLICSSLLKFTDRTYSGFEPIFGKSIDITGAVFLWLGLLILVKNLRSKNNSVFVPLIGLAIVLGTNIFYYGIVDTGMSHVYSFFAFNLFIYSWQKISETHSKKTYFILFGISIGLILVLRPVNILFIPLPILLSWIEKKINLRNIVRILIKPTTILPAALLVIPQLMYWKYLSDSIFQYSYAGESFSNLLTPKIIEFWFSTNNGMLLYTPMWFILLVSLFQTKSPRTIKLFYALSFVGISYIFSSWWNWNYGCGFGCRPFVEFLAFFTLPMSQILASKRNLRIFTFLSFLFILLNLKITYSYDGCWYGENWDWETFGQLILGPTK